MIFFLSDIDMKVLLGHSLNLIYVKCHYQMPYACLQQAKVLAGVPGTDYLCMRFACWQLCPSSSHEITQSGL